MGLLLPNSSVGALANMATLLAGKTLVNLNYHFDDSPNGTAKEDTFSAALAQANIDTVFTSRHFVEKLQQQGLNISQRLANTRTIYLEDLQASIRRHERVSTWLAVRLLPTWLLQRLYCRSRDANATAAIVFPSTSEGQPKGVMLSHRNLMANIKQTSDVLNTQYDDVVIGSLPLFHAFGLTVTQLLPLIEGLPLVCHADPNDTAGIASSVAKHKATLMFGTSDFLQHLNHSPKVHPLMLESLRAVVVSAETLDEQVCSDFVLKFHKPIYKGYGATETAPVASVNLPDSLGAHYQTIQQGSKAGTVGMPLPGTSFKIVEPESFAEQPSGEAGMILISGPQVMQGYLNDPKRTAAAIKELDGQHWFVTGDKGFIDEDGFLTLCK